MANGITHQLVAAATVGSVCFCTEANWETDNKFDEAVRFAILVGIGAYMVYLLLDASTPKSLPIIGVR